MATLEQRPRVEIDVAIRLNESEIRALDALAGYGTDEFLATFFKYMGESYLKPHEAGLRSLFGAVRSQLTPILTRAEAAREAFGKRPW